MNGQQQKNKGSHHHANGNVAELLIKNNNIQLGILFYVAHTFEEFMDLCLLYVVISGLIRTASALFGCTGRHTVMCFLKVGVYNRSLQQEYCA